MAQACLQHYPGNPECYGLKSSQGGAQLLARWLEKDPRNHFVTRCWSRQFSVRVQLNSHMLLINQTTLSDRKQRNVATPRGYTLRGIGFLSPIHPGSAMQLSATVPLITVLPCWQPRNPATAL